MTPEKLKEKEDTDSCLLVVYGCRGALNLDSLCDSNFFRSCKLILGYNTVVLIYCFSFIFHPICRVCLLFFFQCSCRSFSMFS